MFGKKKKTLPETAAKSLNLRPSNVRETYRVLPDTQEPIRACVEREGGSTIQGICMDLSIGGAGVEFEPTRYPELEMGDSCLLKIRTDSHPEAIQATCKVVGIQPLEKGGVRFGFQFVNRIELYAQLDEYYAALFNRRRHVRGEIDPELHAPVQIEWNRGSVSGIAHDVSEGGLGVTLPFHTAAALAKVTNVKVTFALPKQKNMIACGATIKSRTKFENDCLIGLEFLPKGGIADHLEAIRAYVEQYLAALEAWNAKLARRKAS
ncbi:MAG: PilZ domain-containing protein [Planctomycetota bacterium]